MEKKAMQAVEMPYSKMKEYLSEWYYNAQFSTIERPAGYDSVKVFYVLKENNSGSDVFVWMTDVGVPLAEDSVVSTMGIVNEELRGIIEKCYELDIQLNESLSNKTASQNQKGE